MTFALIFLFIVILFTIGFLGLGFWAWTLLFAGVFWTLAVPSTFWWVFAAVAFVFNVKPVRAQLASRLIMHLIQRFEALPKISETEKTALKAGNVWIEGELFSGKPNFAKLMSQPYPKLTDAEQAFIDGPVERLCDAVKDWDVQKNRGLPEVAWEIMKKERFWGMIVPKEYDGLAFSAMAHSEVLQKLGSRNIPLCITAMVPNSLGPAELLNHYGTDEQRKYYLPRLARGEEIPCFALTEPGAGSDAGSLQSTGVLFKGQDGKLYLKLNWNKRYITLAAISTLLGLAFRLKDPDNLLGKGEDLGITCALIPTNTPGVDISRRHDPINVPFYNCPTHGKDVVVSADCIIGGPERAGQGWKMLMECLAAGRGISLPGQSTGAAKLVARIVGAHASVRKQFGVSLGKFEGIIEPMAEIGGTVYLMEAARRYTCGAIDSGMKPPVVTAIAKYMFTEFQRKLVNHCMDIQGGQAISQGPRNLIASIYYSLPVSITVEGANILTRTLIIFGQGALRAHPYAYKQVEAIEEGNLKKFDAAFWSHAGHVVRNKFRMATLMATRGRLSFTGISGPLAPYARKISWASATFAFMADVAMASLGGKLKFKEKLTGRFADVLSWMYLATATMRRFEAEGRRKQDLPFVRWALEHALAEIQEAFIRIYSNMEGPIGWAFRGPVLWLARMNPIGTPPSDALDHQVASLLQVPGEQRDRITSGIYLPKKESEPLARLDRAFELCVQSDVISQKLMKAVKRLALKKQPLRDLIKKAVESGALSAEEARVLDDAEKARNDAIQVDDFGLDEYLNVTKNSPLKARPVALSGGSDPVVRVTGIEPVTPPV